MAAGVCGELPWQEVPGMRCHKVKKLGLQLGVAEQLDEFYLRLMDLHGSR
jgi:hypothetical protein